MKVGVIGSGGREHALCQSLRQSKEISQIYCFPGNAGTDQIARNIDIDLSNFEQLKNFIIKEKINSKSNIINKNLPDDDPLQRKPDITLANEVLNWHPKISLNEGLNKTITYFQENLKI